MPAGAPGVDDESLHFTIRKSPDDPHPQGFPKSLGTAHGGASSDTGEDGIGGDSRRDSWRVRRDFESILRAMQRANDRQKMLAAHGALLSDERLQLVVDGPAQTEVARGPGRPAWRRGSGPGSRPDLPVARRDRRQTSPRLLHARNPLRAKPRQAPDELFHSLAQNVYRRWPPRAKS